MTDYAREARLKKKREYYRDWRARNPDSVKKSQAKYWAKKVEELRAAALPNDIETRDSERSN